MGAGVLRGATVGHWGHWGHGDVAAGGDGGQVGLGSQDSVAGEGASAWVALGDSDGC